MRRSFMGRSSSALHLALAGDVLVAAVKFAGAAATGSSALFSEGVHSTVDAVSEILLLYGLWVGKRPSTSEHQLGFGREVFFWNFIVAMTILAVGAGVALLDGIHQILRASVIESPLISYGVLLLALLAEIPAMISVSRGVHTKRGKTGFVHFLRMSRDPTMLTVLFGGASGILGILIAAIGTFLTTMTGSSMWDGVASVMIAMILGTTALFLAATSKKLLIGVTAAPSTVSSILEITTDCPDVEMANGAITVHLAPDQILVALSVAFRPALTTQEIEVAVAAIDRAVRAAHPSVVVFLLKPQSEAQFETLRGYRGW
ncbi:cation diffusion facilitator family transporter [Sphingomonas faeni]|uniref:cation diffusion facilitator family transporter n=1 Tax=Sphingomonas faeni TaxID=185950 RepID=UPI00278B5DB9|nr:cation diffusion facilitator family transporter [Sphingomonas faeni]MDQ0839335.1 cation diffusion facilitator family transporter [Sphingomonas faeni]